MQSQALTWFDLRGHGQSAPSSAPEQSHGNGAVCVVRTVPSFQDARFELAHIGNGPQGQPPNVLFLTQLRERINYMRYEVKTGMTQEELGWLLKVVNAYPGGGPAYKAARALALNRQPVQAQQWLRKVCKISSPDECALIKRVWAKDAQTNSLVATVPWPDEKQLGN